MQTGNTDFIHGNELDKACFQHDMAYGKSKDLTKRTQSDKVLIDKALKIASDTKYNDYQRLLGLLVYKFFDKKSSGSGVDVSLANKSATELNFQRAKELYRKIFKNSRDKMFIHLLQTIFVA